MIERQALLIGPWRWQRAGELLGWHTDGWGRVIADGLSATPLGCVRSVRRRRAALITPQEVEVCETEDASRLMTLRHYWFGLGRWHIFDAESDALGSVLLPYVLDGDGYRFGAVMSDRMQGRYELRRRAGDPCATFEPNGFDLLVRFDDDLEANPFLRMLILGAALALTPLPG